MTNVLLVEDNKIDARLMQRMFSDIKAWPTQITWVDDGQKALWYLESLEAGGVPDPPDLILLDLNLPKYDGLQVLEAFRKSVASPKAPIFLMSCSPREEIEAITGSRHLHADAYLEKPYCLEGFETLAIEIRSRFQSSSLDLQALARHQTMLAARSAEVPKTELVW